MSEKRREFIDQLLSDLKLLEERLLSVKESDTLPFSFFSDSFNRVEKISRSLHELELMQIGEMKEQMKRLVQFLSDAESANIVSREKDSDDSSEEPQKNTTEEMIDGDAETVVPETVLFEKETVHVTEKIILPEYRDPRLSVENYPPLPTVEMVSEEVKETAQSLSFNDVVKAPSTLLDLKREMSLNDLFLFQRELFNNNRDEMNRVMETLGAMDSYESVENYLKSERNWNFENQTVKDFLLIVKKGFK